MSSILRVGRHNVIPPIMQIRVVSPRTAAAAAASWWVVAGKTCVAAYQPKGAASYAASLVNLASPGTHDAAAGVAPTFDTATGWTFDGATTYLDSGVIPYNTQDQCLIVRFSGLAAVPQYPSWSYRGNGRMFGIQADGGANNRMQYINGAGGVKVPFATSGVCAVSGNRGYRNGMDEGISIGAWTGAIDRTLYVGAGNAGVATGFVDGKIQALAYYSNSLTAGEIAALTTRMQAL